MFVCKIYVGILLPIYYIHSRSLTHKWNKKNISLKENKDCFGLHLFSVKLIKPTYHKANDKIIQLVIDMSYEGKIGQCYPLQCDPENLFILLHA